MSTVTVYDYHGHAVNAVDGNPNPNYWKSSCTATQNDMEPWWRADLHKIHSVRVTNRGDRCAQCLNGAEIRIGDSLDNNGHRNPKCATIKSIAAGGSETFHCGDMPGRYVNIFIPGRREYLTLCEVEIFGSSEYIPADLTMIQVSFYCKSIYSQNNNYDGFAENLSERCRPSQSSVYDYHGHAVNAVNGNPNPNYWKSSCTAAQNDMEPWWRADLHKIHSVRVTNRGDCCAQRLNGEEIRIGDSLDNNGHRNPKCATIKSIAAGGSETFHCGDMPGRYVNIFIPGRREYLTLCEVEIFGSSEC
ncbi:uncharacterized protein LOC109922784 [Rhincodon typus]|uniref:uncharacterized protein LOC109922784 n=1 Tax=Rhincodon typus TaxID=259920 RepID=UPI00202E0F53|nr:uncharacterized protein LOC109922784 [Rhincodon typus]